VSIHTVYQLHWDVLNVVTCVIFYSCKPEGYLLLLQTKTEDIRAMGGQQSQPLQQQQTNGGGATTPEGYANHQNAKDDECRPCFLFFSPQLPFIASKKNDPVLGSPLPDTPMMERRRRQAAVKQATTALHRDHNQQQRTNEPPPPSSSILNSYHPSSRYEGLEKEESSASFSNASKANLIPPPVNDKDHHLHHLYCYSTATGYTSGGFMTPPNNDGTLRKNVAMTEQESANIYEGDDCEEKLHAKYELCEVLGVGSTSTVHRCINKATGCEYACKIIDLQYMDDKFHTMMIQFHTEIESLKSLHHPGIIQLYDVYILSTQKIYIIMEFMDGGELFDYVVEKGTLTEEEASQIVRVVLSAVRFVSHIYIYITLQITSLDIHAPSFTTYIETFSLSL
jgi:Protein kinase domain